MVKIVESTVFWSSYSPKKHAEETTNQKLIFAQLLLTKKSQTSHLKTSFSCLTLFSGYFLGHVSSRKALAYARGPAFTWVEGESHVSSMYWFHKACEGLCACVDPEQAPGHWCCPAVWAAGGSCPPRWRSRALWFLPLSCSSHRWPPQWGSDQCGVGTSPQYASSRTGNSEWLQEANNKNTREELRPSSLQLVSISFWLYLVIKFPHNTDKEIRLTFCIIWHHKTIQLWLELGNAHNKQLTCSKANQDLSCLIRSISAVFRNSWTANMKSVDMKI